MRMKIYKPIFLILVLTFALAQASGLSLTETGDNTALRREDESLLRPRPFLESEKKLGANLSCYTIKGVIKTTEMSTVYEGEDVTTGKRVAIKKLSPDLAGNGFYEFLFQQEIEILERFMREGYQYSAEIFGHGKSWFAMEYLEGDNIADWIFINNPDPLEILAKVKKLLKTLAIAHKMGIIHCDIKAQNIFILKDKPENDVRLLDFGIAYVKGILQPGRKEENPGTPYLFPPEQFKKTISPIFFNFIYNETVYQPSYDLYQLGLLLYSLVVGEQLYRGSDEFTTLYRIVYIPSPTKEAIIGRMKTEWQHIPEIADIIAKAVSKEPCQRYASAEEMEAAVNAAEKNAMKRIVREALARRVRVEKGLESSI